MPQPESRTRNVWLTRYARVVALSTLVLIFAGGLVTSTGSGLAVPDWPLSYGKLFPPMVGGILFEHGHRMVAGTVALMMAALLVWVLRSERRKAVRRVAMIAMGAVLAQAVLGGLTVLFLLPDAISIAHAGLAEIFFSLTVTLAVLLSRGWHEAPPRRAITGGPFALPYAAAALTGIIYVQILLGAVMRHTGAGLAIPDFPLSYGKIVPPSLAGGIAIHFAHRVGALVVTLGAVSLLTLILRHRPRDPWIVRPGIVLVSLVLFQIILGALTIWTMKAVIPTTLHVAIGASTLATSLIITLRTFRLYRPEAGLVREEALPRGIPA